MHCHEMPGCVVTRAVRGVGASVAAAGAHDAAVGGNVRLEGDAALHLEGDAALHLVHNLAQYCHCMAQVIQPRISVLKTKL